MKNRFQPFSKLSFLLVCVAFSGLSEITAQSEQEIIKTIYSQSLTNGKSYEWLDHLSNEIGGGFPDL